MTLFIEGKSIANLQDILQLSSEMSFANVMDMSTSDLAQSLPKQDSAELLTKKYVQLDEKISKLISKIKSVRGKLEHKFHQIGL